MEKFRCEYVKGMETKNMLARIYDKRDSKLVRVIGSMKMKYLFFWNFYVLDENGNELNDLHDQYDFIDEDVIEVKSGKGTVRVPKQYKARVDGILRQLNKEQ